jgi:uncharacterized protein
MIRGLQAQISQDLDKKLILLAGARQVGKSTLARNLIKQFSGAQSFNFDVAADRKIIDAQAWSPAAPLVVFDELHKMPQWKAWLKGVYDGRKAGQRILVTGSARLDFLRAGGDSLAGRFFAHRLHPITVAEWCAAHPGGDADASAEAALTRILTRGGFPEPMLAEEDADALRWRRQYIDGLVREDVLEFSRLHEVNTMRVLVDLLRERVGSPLSVASLARDLNASHTTITRYIEILEALFIIFTIHPWHRNISRSLLKAPKVYFMDSGLVRGDDGAKFENVVACALLAAVHGRQDREGRDCELHYLRTKDGAKVDFAISENNTLSELIECKWMDAAPHRALARFAEQFGEAKATQIVRYAGNAARYGNVAILPAAPWLRDLK